MGGLNKTTGFAVRFEPEMSDSNTTGSAVQFESEISGLDQTNRFYRFN